jgi:phage tail sheath gpL-like
MAANPIGLVYDLSATDKVPGSYLQTVFGVGGGGGNPIRTMLLIAARASGGGTLTPDTQVADVLADGDEVALTGGYGNELQRMVAIVRKYFPTTRIKIATVTQSSTAAATATITIGGSWTVASSGPLMFWIGGCPIQVFALSSDTATTFGDAIVAAITATPQCPVTAANNAGEVTLTWKSYGTRGNDGILYADSTYKPSGMTVAVAGGSSVASGGVRFTGGTATENMTTLLSTLEPDPYWTIVTSIIDATNLARLETALDAKCGALVRLFGNVVVGSTKALASSTSLAQTTLDNVRFEMVEMEEGETPAEEQAAWVGALRHQREQINPNQKYDGIATPFVPQRAPSKRMNHARQVAALDVGLTCIPTRNDVAYIARAITTRSLLSSGAADDGTIDVGQARTPDVINEEIGSLWLAYTDSEDATAHHYLRDNPDPGSEADVPAGTTYPLDWQQQVQAYMKEREARNWVTGVDAHPTVVNMHPTSSTPRFVQYTPVIVTPLTHQLEGTIAQTKFIAA